MIKLISKSVWNTFFTNITKPKNPPARHYQNNKEKLQERSCERYQNLSEEEKEHVKNRKHGCKGYKHLSENQKWELVRYRKKCYKIRKKDLL